MFSTLKQIFTTKAPKQLIYYTPLYTSGPVNILNSPLNLILGVIQQYSLQYSK